jgi:ABC-type dipeptide/oligopeptide/nickel transport system ATPase subunit
MTVELPEQTPAAAVSAAAARAIIGFDRVTKEYRGGRFALDDVTLAVPAGGSLGLVGESGSGKTTCVRLALGLERPTSGQLTFDGAPYPSGRRKLRPLRRQIGFVLQDPYDSLDPRMTIRDIVSEPLRVGGAPVSGRDDLVAAQLDAVGLPGADLRSYPSRYSGGGRQRIAIARALIAGPAVLICDEPTSSLDVSVQSQIVNLLLEARRQHDLSMLFVSHDLDLIGRVVETVAVMYGGRVVETGPAADIRRAPRHHYTRSLHDAVPVDHPRNRRLGGRVGAVSEAGITLPGLLAGSGADSIRPVQLPVSGVNDRPVGQPPVSGIDDLPVGQVPGSGVDDFPVGRQPGCVFASRCPAVTERCRTERPPMIQESPTRSYACFFPIPDETGAQ